MEKLSKTARLLDKIIKVLRGLCAGFGIACAILLAVCIFLPDALYSNFVSSADMTVDLGNVQLHLSRVLEPTGSIRLPICAILASTLVILGLSAAGLHLLHKILLPMTEQQPFGGSVSGNLRKLGWLYLVGGVVFFVLGGVTATLEIGMFELDQLFAPGLVTGVTVQNTVNFTLLLIPALLFLLSYVFRYGEELQKLSDETL